jgi:flagellar biosynthesis protein FlhB
MATSGEKTEEPTPKRLEEARRRGDLATSRELTSAAATAAATIALLATAPSAVARLLGHWRQALGTAAAAGPPGAALAAGVEVMARALAPPLLAALAAALAVGFLQTRGVLALGALRPDFGRLSPRAGLARIVGGQAAREVGKGAVKIAAVAAIVWITLRPALGGLTSLSGASIERTFAVLGALFGRIALRVTLVGLAIGVADFLIARRQHLRRLRMTREEVKRETKESEGDPSHRAERQRLHRELTEQRMLDDVRKADFVVINPDHIAVALRYDRDGDAAPVVVARGERLLAEQIKQIAREAGVPVFRDVTLARSLRDLPEGDEIPPALYEAVAEILRVVYGMNAPAGELTGALTGAPTGPAPSGGSGAPDPKTRHGAGWKRA